MTSVTVRSGSLCFLATKDLASREPVSSNRTQMTTLTTLKSVYFLKLFSFAILLEILTTASVNVGRYMPMSLAVI